MSARARQDEQGMVLVWFALLLVPLLVMAALSVDVGRWYVVVGDEQKAADAASLAGVVHMPGDFAEATTVALSIAGKNGFSAAQGDVIAVTRTTEPNQLKVTITTTVENFFAPVIGMDTQTITRSAVAEFQGPTPMGSPSNTLGNEPLIPGEDGEPWRDTVDPVANNPQHWLEIAGPRAKKHDGDRYSSRNCELAPYNCVDGVNVEWNEGKGYHFVVRARPTAADIGKYLVVQLYDPALVSTGNTCTESSMTGLPGLPASPRYQTGPNPFCTGDHTGTLVRTDYQLYEPTPENQYGSAVTPQAGCSKGWDSFKGNIGAEMTANPTGAVATTFHRWTDLCRVLITEAGVQDFVLQVRTSGAGNSQTSGDGHNRYAIRTGMSSASAPPIAPAIEARPDGTKTSMFAAGRLPMFANLNAAATTFYLARVLPGAGGSTLRVTFYDTGDADQAGRLTVRPPSRAVVRNGAVDTPLTSFPSCTTTKTGSGSLALADNGCTLTNVQRDLGYNGQLVQMLVAIPEGYWCDQTVQLDCWVRVTFNYPVGSGVTDVTTWDATIDGDPVRLVQ